MQERILIVDDEPHIRRILKFLLEQKGYQVLSAADGLEAVSMARENMPDLILLDLMMPHMDGFEVCRHLRAEFATAQIPVIMVTAKGEVADKVKGFEGGANDYLTKPYDNKELLARVQRMLQWSQSQRQANPLTGLPGNQAIGNEIQRRISLGEAFAFLYLDIDHFKAYNDTYGYQRGDEVIRFLANLLRECSNDIGTESDFIGHIGGDDFCLICGAEVGETLGQVITARFDEESRNLIDADDLTRGYLNVRSRQGGMERVGFPCLTIALVLDPGGEFEHWARVSDVAAELKAYGKSLEGSVVIKERRQVPEDAEVQAPLTDAPQ